MTNAFSLPPPIIYIYIYARHILVPWTRLVVVHEAGNMDRARRQPEMRANTVGCNARDRVAVLSRRFPAPVVHGLVSRARVVVSVGQVCICVYTTRVHAGTYIERKFTRAARSYRLSSRPPGVRRIFLPPLSKDGFSRYWRVEVVCTYVIYVENRRLGNLNWNLCAINMFFWVLFF